MHAPNQIMPLTIIFFDCPPTFEVMRDKEMTNDAWYEPVR